MRAKAIYACIAENPGEITFDAHDTLTNISDSAEDGWLTGTVQRTGDRGLFPVVYTELQPETGDDQRFLQTLQTKGLLSSTLRLDQFAQTQPLPPPVPVKSAAVLARTASSASVGPNIKGRAPLPPVSAKPTVGRMWEERQQQQQQQQTNSAKPVLPPKPMAAGAGDGDTEARIQREREAAMEWEARHGIKVGAANSSGSAGQAARPPISAKPAFASERTRPPVPANKPVSAKPAIPSGKPRPPVPARTPSTASLSSSSMSLTSGGRGSSAHLGGLPLNPAAENDAPALPYNASRQVGVAQAARAVPVLEKIQPAPRSLISKLNGMGFEDSFQPVAASASVPASVPASASASSLSSSVSPLASPGQLSRQPSTQSAASIPLTAARHVQGAAPRPTPTAPANKRQLSYVKRQPVLTQSHPGYRLPPASGARSDVIPMDALTRYSHLFKRLDKESGRKGYLASDQVHAVVVRCRLPDDQMRRIWALADRNLNGRFGPGEFNLVMHLADCALRHDPIPDTLSVDLLHSAY
ncbi:Intersectin 1 (SH3 domain protein) [Coemansia sp. RSA 1286]|nr:Intersectin 1 (SH3 domain protein) [Coemansia sp. RSA 1286]